MFTIGLIAYALIYGFTLLVAVVVVYHFNRFGLKGDYPGKFFVAALMFFSLALAAVNIGIVGKLQAKKLQLPFPAEFKLFDFGKGLPFND